MLRVLPWPSDDEPGYCNIHYMMHQPDGSKPWSGTPCRDVDQFLNTVYSMQNWSLQTDMYFCLSRQAKTKPNGKGKEVAAKSQQEALALKAVWYDVDVGKDDGYQTIPDAIAAVQKLCAAENLPKPSAWVASGGGLHVYWFSNQPLTPAQWQPYADGLKELALKYKLLGKGDYGVTTDSARVLRIPGTLNRKQPVPRPVKLLLLEDTDYDFPTALALLPSIAPTITRPVIALLGGRPSPAFASLSMESLSAGLERREYPPLNPAPMLKQCAHFRDALINGGKDFSQGLWNLTTLAATFMENGHDLAHKMARGYPEYHYDQTEALWERKVTERAANGLGWPSCRSIQAEGCAHCATCPVLAIGKSPLHLARISNPTPVASTVAPYVANSQTNSTGTVSNIPALVPVLTTDLPFEFNVDQDIIHRIVTTKPAGQAPTTDFLPLFHNSLYNVWPQVGPDAMNFTVSVDKGSYHQGQIKLIDMTSNRLEDALLTNRVKPVSDHLKYVKGLMVSWLAKLHAAAAAQSSSPFGWHMTGNFCEGFSYGSVLYKHDGTRGPAGMMDPTTRSMYEPQGELQPWYDAFKVITDQHRPGLEAMVATSFASPLMFASGEYVGVLSVYSSETGVGKSTAMRVALAVWGNPKLAKENEGATEKSVLERLGQIKVLPYMWDEIKDEAAQDKAYTILYRSGGKGNSKLLRDSSQREVSTWCNLIMIAANKSFIEHIIKRNPDTAAGMVRVLEWPEHKPGLNAPGQISRVDVGNICNELDTNYGQMGKLWAAFLGQNRDLCAAHVKANVKWFEAQTNVIGINSNEERFWGAICGTVLSGAELANQHLGLNFDVVAMRAFLLKKYMDQRTGVTETHIEGGSVEWVEDLLSAFLKSYRRSTLHTDKSAVSMKGRPDVIDILTPLPEHGYPTHVHWIHTPGTLLISKREFTAWIKTQKSEARLMVEGMKQHYGARTVRSTLGAGTPYNESQEALISIPVPQGSNLWKKMTHPPEDTPVTDAVTDPAMTGAVTNGDMSLMFANPDAQALT